MKKDSLIIANKKFNSRLIVGTGKYKSMSECAKAIKLSGAEIVTVAVRRVNILDKKKLSEKIKSYKPDWVINAAAYTNVDDAEINKEIGIKIINAIKE